MTTTRWPRVTAVAAAGVVVAALLPQAATLAAPAAAPTAAVALLDGVGCADLDPAGGATTSIPAGAIALPTRGGEITSATLVPAATTNGVAYPEYCDVKGTLDSINPHASDIDFEIDVPTAWNGSAWQFGGAASDGSVPALTGTNDATPDEVPPLAQGYAVYGSDSGHQVPGGGAWVTTDESWLNFAYQQIKKTHDASVWVMNYLYGQGPFDNFWVGSSQGGREGLEAITRYPDDYQGAAVEVPLAEFANLLFNPGYQGQIQLRPGGYLPPAKADAIADYVLDACDGLDGLRDGVINDYLDCDHRFDPTLTKHPFAGLACTGTETDSCLTPPETRTLESFYSPIKYPYPLSNGETTYPGWGTGLENVGALGTFVPLPPWLFSAAPPTPHDPAYTGGGGGLLGGQVAQEWFAKQLRDPDFSLLDIDLKKDEKQLKLLSQQLDVSSDIHRYLADGGKLVMMTNASDAISNPRAQMDLYNEWLDNPVNGGVAAVRRGVQYYVLPNQGHVGGAVDAEGNPIPSAVDLQGIVQSWVEDGTPPPAAPVARTVADGSPTGGASPTKPVCEYPLYPHYVGGSADPSVASSYTCRLASVARPKPSVRVTARPVRAGTPGKATVVVGGVSPAPSGRITVSVRGARRSFSAVLRNGRAIVSLGRLPVGRHVVVASYAGSDATAAATGRTTLLVKRRRR